MIPHELVCSGLPLNKDDPGCSMSISGILPPADIMMLGHSVGVTGAGDAPQLQLPFVGDARLQKSVCAAQ